MTVQVETRHGIRTFWDVLWLETSNTSLYFEKNKLTSEEITAVKDMGGEVRGDDAAAFFSYSKYTVTNP